MERQSTVDGRIYSESKVDSVGRKIEESGRGKEKRRAERWQQLSVGGKMGGYGGGLYMQDGLDCASWKQPIRHSSRIYV